MEKFIFVSGGVCSSLGKGVASAMGVVDALERSRFLGDHLMHKLEAYTCVAILFVFLSLICYIFERIFKYLEKH